MTKTYRRHLGSTEEADEFMIQEWNRRVCSCDTVYHLGDVGWYHRELSEILPRLNGEICLIKGNHDAKVACRKSCRDRFAWIKDIYDFKFEENGNKNIIVLCHYGMRVWNRRHYGSIHLYGHSHGHLPSYGRSMDVGVDCWNYAPVSLEEVLANLPTWEETKEIAKADEARREIDNMVLST